MLHVTLRVGRVLVGLVLMLGGAVLALPGVPGPGLLLVVGGLALLGHEFHWARRANEWLVERGKRIVGRNDA
jgi:putative transmembrane protein PGPGW